jgi:hypothetical protein
LRAHVFGEFVAIARAPFVFAVAAGSREQWNSADESAALVAEDAAISSRCQTKFVDQGSRPPSRQELEHNKNKPGCPALSYEKQNQGSRRILPAARSGRSNVEVYALIERGSRLQPEFLAPGLFGEFLNHEARCEPRPHTPAFCQR